MKGTVREYTVHDSPPQNGVAERGMRTRAERARALLLASGLPRFLWEEAMKHTTWLQNRTPACALDGKTPYEMKNKEKPHLSGIQEFGVAAYVKDLKAGKLDARVQVGHFVGYDSESKGYRIYWPRKRSITVERNVVFNQNDVCEAENITISSRDTLSEGEKDKIIQNPESNVKVVEKYENNSNSPVHHQSEPRNTSTVQEEKESNTIPFPTVPETENQPKSTSNDDDDLLQLGHGQHVAPKPQGVYKKMHFGLVAGIAQSNGLDDDELSIELSDDHDKAFMDLPPDFALISGLNSEPTSIDEALHGPDVKKWQEALDYEINQLEKMGTWVIETYLPDIQQYLAPRY